MRRYLITAAAALAAAGVTVGLTLATRTDTPHRVTQKGVPPLLLDFGVRTDPEAVALRRASDLYDAGKVAQAHAIFAGYDTLEGRVGQLLAAWPGSFGDLHALAQKQPRSSLVQLEYGLALFWRGNETEAETAWRAARRVQPDTPYALRAEDLLHPNFPRGLPQFVPSFPSPPALARLSPPEQLVYLRKHANDDRGHLLYGVAFQRLGKQLSALAQYRQVGGVEGQVAVAVGLFDKANPSKTFSRLGPLARRYPKNQSVRFHLGLCLLWLGSVDKAKQELRLARTDGPKTTLGVEAQRFLERLP